MCLRVCIFCDCLFAFNIEAYEYFSGGFDDFAQSAFCFVIFDTASVRIYQLSFHWKDFCEIWYCILVWKSVENVQNLFIIGQIIGPFTWNLSTSFTVHSDTKSQWNPSLPGLHVKWPIFLSDSNQTWIFSIDVHKDLQYQILPKPV